MQLLALLGALALLVCNTAAGLASGLARGLALAAAAVLSAVAQVTSLDGLDMFHNDSPPNLEFYENSLPQYIFRVNPISHTFHAYVPIQPGV